MPGKTRHSGEHLVVACPATDGLIETNVRITEAGLKGYWSTAISNRCPRCRGSHCFRINDAYIEQALGFRLSLSEDE